MTEQRDISVLERLKDLSVDDLDEDTSVLPDLKISKRAAATSRDERGSHRAGGGATRS
ncbi:MAG: hypothetical protein R3F14_24615 [Polyangiaceae bacterium]